MGNERVKRYGTDHLGKSYLPLRGMKVNEEDATQGRPIARTHQTEMTFCLPPLSGGR